jgi:hypothetical protein
MYRISHPEKVVFVLYFLKLPASWLSSNQLFAFRKEKDVKKNRRYLVYLRNRLFGFPRVGQAAEFIGKYA